MPPKKSGEQFDWNFNESPPRQKIEQLQSLKFIERNEIALLLGSPGTGKSHCAIIKG